MTVERLEREGVRSLKNLLRGLRLAFARWVLPKGYYIVSFKTLTYTFNMDMTETK